MKIRCTRSAASRGSTAGSTTGSNTAFAKESVLLAVSAILHAGSGLGRTGATSFSLGVVRDTHAASSVVLLLAGVGKSLGKGRTLAHCWALPVNDVDGNDKHERDAEENRTGILEVSAARSADIREERNGGNGQDTSKEVTL